MNDLAPRGGGSGSAVDKMDRSEIERIVDSDAGQIERMREQSKGWSKLETISKRAHEILGSAREAQLGGESRALSTAREKIKEIESTASNTESSAKGNSTAMTNTANETERLKGAIDKLKKDSADLLSMAGMDAEDFKQLTGAEQEKLLGELQRSVTEDMRAEMSTSEEVYRESYLNEMRSTPEYEGLPKWNGPRPEIVPIPESSDDYEDGGVSRAPTHGASTGDGGGFPTNGGSDGSPSTEGPDLQGPAPAGSLPGGAPGGPPATPPSTSGGGGVAPILPGGPRGGGLPVSRAVPPPAGGGRGLGTGARATPGMSNAGTRGTPGGMRPNGMAGRPGVGGAPQGGRGGGAGRPGSGMGPGASGRPGNAGGSGRYGAGRMGSGPTKAERSMLPNQRSAAKNAKADAARAQAKGGAAIENPFAQTRKTVPAVIGNRGSSGYVNAQLRSVVAEGKVFGERTNKSRNNEEPSRPKISKKILNQHGIATSRAEVRPWTNWPGRDTGTLASGKVFGMRESKAPKKTAAQLKEEHRRRMSSKRTEILDAWRERKAREEHPITEGLDDTVVPPVIKPPKPGDRVTRSDTGPVFGSGGWEHH